MSSTSEPSGDIPPGAAATPRHCLLMAIGMRLRFVLLVGLLATVVWAWPAVQQIGERLVLSWAADSSTAAVSGDTEFFCPMDPGVLSAWPAICPVCHMDLIARKKSDAQLLPEGTLSRMQLSPYRVQLAGVRTVAVTRKSPEGPLQIPVSAVVHHESGPVVYVERMRGMFDGTPVELGARTGSEYELTKGIAEGDRVVAIGAFLIDAESQLNPNIALQYFGAGHHLARTEPPPLLEPGQRGEPLSAADIELVARQRICPVTEAALGSMGQPVIIEVDGERVALCCRGCEGRVRADPQKYLQRKNVPLPASGNDESKEAAGDASSEAPVEP